MSEAFYPQYRDGRLDRQVENLLRELAKKPSLPLRLRTPQDVRKNSSVKDWILPWGKSTAVEYLSIAGPGGELPIRIYRPAGEGPFPTILYFHGGGWVFGSLDEADHLCEAFSFGLPSVVVSVGYRLSPESRYPAALEDARAALAWARREIARYKGDPSAVATAGESAGANLATVVSLIARDRGEAPIAFQLLLCPVVDLQHREGESFSFFGKGHWLSKENLEYYYDQYLAEPDEAREPYVSPLLAKDLRGMPATHIVTAEFDVLRDEGEAYGRRLREAGVKVTQKRYEGMIHSFFVLNKIFDRANEAITDCIQVMRSHFLQPRNSVAKGIMFDKH